MPPVSILIKPASSLCNLRCTYCFYHSISETRSIPSYGIMSADILETIVKNAMEYADNVCTFAFQGGEPTLAGLDFFVNFIQYVKQYNKKNMQINYALQTNGIAIDDKWAEFLAQNKFLVGISLDGPKDLHDITRFDANKKGSFNRVMETISLFNRHNVEYNILCVVNSWIARHISKVYNFFMSNNFQYLQFIPCLDPLEEAPGSYEYSLSPKRYAYFLKTLFDLWYNDFSRGNMISIRYFDNLVTMLAGYPPESCGMSGICGSYFTIEANGGVYPCDFYVLDKWYMGNVTESSFDQLVNSDSAREFIEVSKYVDPQCKSCKYFSLCRGGCRRSREPFTDGRPVLNYYCSAYKEFFEYAGERLVRVTKALVNR